MQTEHQIVRAVYGAKEDSGKADELIRACIPFIRSEATKYLTKLCTDQDDEYSIWCRANPAKKSHPGGKFPPG